MVGPHGVGPEVPAVFRGRRRPPQTSDVVKKSGRRFFAVFGLRGPSTGPGSAKKRLRMKNWSWGKGRDFRGPLSERIQDRRLWAAFGLWRPSTGPGAVRKRLGTNNRSRGKGRDFRGPRIDKKHDIGCLGLAREGTSTPNRSFVADRGRRCPDPAQEHVVSLSGACRRSIGGASPIPGQRLPP